MSAREEAIKKLLDDGEDLTEENITAAMEAEKPKPDTNREVVETLNKLNDNMVLLRDEVKAQGLKEIRIPNIKMPEIKVPEQRIIQVPEQRKPRKLSFSFVRDANGNIINVTATEE